MHLLAFAALILPVVLGDRHCCLPNKLFGNVYNSGQGVLSRVAIDFSAGRYVLRSVLPKATDFTLFDFVVGKQYTMNNKGICKITAVDTDNSIERCIPNTATKLGASYMGKPSFLVSTYQYTVGTRNMTLAVTQHDCYPVVSVSDQDMTSQTNIFGNLQNTSMDATSLLNPDTANCVEDDSTIG